MKDFLKKVLETGGPQADQRLVDLQKLLEANRDQDFTGPVPEAPARTEKDTEILKNLGFTEEQIRCAQELPDESGIDPDQWAADWRRRGEENQQSFLMATEIMRAVVLELKNFKTSREQTAGEMKESFTPGSDLGDLLLISSGNEEALYRFLKRRPHLIHRARYRAFRKEFDGTIREWMESGERSKEAILKDVNRAAVLIAAGQILQEGWRTSKPRGPGAKERSPRIGRKPMEKAVEFGGGFTVLLREPTPLGLEGLLSGDAATLDDRILKASIVGAGAWRATAGSPEEVTAFLQDFTPTELARLLQEAQGFVVECVQAAVAAAFQLMGEEATRDLLGGRSRAEAVMARRPEPEFELSRSLDGPEKFRGLDVELIEQEAEKELMDRLGLMKTDFSARDREIVSARTESRNLKDVAFKLGISHAAARQAWSRIVRKARKNLSLKK